MGPQFTLPLDTRAVGDGGPPVGGNGLTDALLAMRIDRHVLNTVHAGGADPTGTHDSTAAIAAAYAAASAGQVVFFRDGIYKISSPLRPPPGVITVLGPAGFDPRAWGDSASGCVIAPSAEFTGSAVFELSAGSAIGAAGTQGRPAATQGPAILGGAIDGANLAVAADGIRATGPVNAVVLRDFFIANVTGAGINCVRDPAAAGQSYPYGWHVSHVKIDSPGKQGVVAANHTDAVFYDVHVINSGSHAWSFAGPCPNSRFIACKGEWSARGFHGFHLVGSWSSGTGSGGMTFVGCSTDRCGAHGLNVTATGNVPVHFSACMFRRDGRNGGAGGGGYAGVAVNASTLPLTFDGLLVWPGVDDTGSGASSPEYGVSVSNKSSHVAINSGYIQGAIRSIHDDGSSADLTVSPWVVTATGTTGAPAPDASPFPSHVARPWLDASGESSSSRAVMRVADTNASAVQAVIEADAAAAANPAIGTRVTGDRYPQFQVSASGDLRWGSGSAAGDAGLFRAAPGMLQTEGSLTIGENLVQAGTSVASTSLASVADTEAETTLVSVTLPTGILQAGTAFRINVMGTIQVAATSGILTFRPYLGGAAAAQSPRMPSQFSAAGPVGFHLEMLIAVYATGTAGRFVAHGRGEIEFPSRVSLTVSSTTTTAIDSTQADPVIKLTAAWQTANPSNSLQVSIATIEKVAG
jgi:hypothetical protein